MSQCDKIREELQSWDAFESLSGLILHGSDGLPCDGDGVLQESVRHAQTCESCRSWLKGIVPLDEEDRLSRLEKYCCPVMFGAVEYKDEDELHIRLLQFQGESVWAITNFGTIGGSLLISYCPWCGSKMPNENFIDDSD